MADPNLVFNPPTGWLDTDVMVTNPANQDATREQFQRLFTQIQDFENGTMVPYVKGLDGENVKKTTDQTIDGVKTFASSPIVPTPTTDMQASTKKYVDDNFTAKTEITTSRKLSETGDFTGTLNGMPILQDQTGLSSTVAYHTTQLAEKANIANVLGYGLKEQRPVSPNIADLFFLTDEKKRIEFNGTRWQYLDGTLLDNMKIIDGNIYSESETYTTQNLTLGQITGEQSVDMTKDLIWYTNIKLADSNDFCHFQFSYGATLQLQLTIGYDWVGRVANGVAISLHDYINVTDTLLGSVDFYTTAHDVVLWYDHKLGYLNVYVDKVLIGSFKPASGGANLDGSNALNFLTGSANTTQVTLAYYYMAKPLVTAIGDSITAGAIKHSPDPTYYVGVDNYSNSYPKLLSDYLKTKGIKNYFVVNKGVNSETTTDMKTRFTTDIVNTQCKYVLIHGGINDYPSNDTSLTTQNKIDMANTAIASSITPLILGVMPTKEGNAAHSYSIPLHAAEIANYTNYNYADLWDVIEGTTENVADNAKMDDTVHPNATGYAALATEIEKYILI